MTYFTVEIPGQPPSGNHANKIGRGYRRGGISYPKIVKTDEAEAYQTMAGLIVKAASKNGWKWSGGLVVCEYWLYLSRDADCTNIWKVVEDGIFPGLGVNDKWSLPRAMYKTIVPKGEARVEVKIYNIEEEGSWPKHKEP